MVVGRRRWSRISISPERTTKNLKFAVADMDEHVAGRVGRQRRRRAAAELGDLGVGEGGKGYFVQIELSHGFFTTTYLRMRGLVAGRGSGDG